MPSEFVHLHVHTEFSLLDGQSQIKDLIGYAKELDMPAVGISDHGVMFGVIDFFRAAKQAGIKPVIGMEAYLAPRKMTDKDPVHDKRPYHMLLWAQNMTGYRNLMKMASAAQLEGYYYRPRIDWDYMAAHSEGVIATSGCLAAQIPRMVEDGRDDEARNLIGRYLDTFGEDNFYLELQPHKIDQLDILNKWLHDYWKSNHTQVGLLATNDVHYVRQDDWDVHDTLLCIQTGAHKSEENRMRMSPHDSYFMKTADEMRAEFHKRGVPNEVINEAFANSLKIADMTDVELDTDEYHLPVFPVPPEFDGDEGAYLRYLVEMGLSWRFPGREDDAVLRKRIDRELGIIGDMGFNTYFLIVWDLCEFARHADIWWNVRGSGAGSLVAYCLGITNVDPILNSLLFERFLNPGRVSMPDIDLDYPDDRRGEMIAYSANKYGKDKVAAIITFGTMGAKAAVKDVGRALNVDLAKINQATSLIPQEARQKKIKEYIELNPDLQNLYNRDEEIRRVMDTAIRLQGMTRHASTHAAGVIIADKSLEQYTPLHRITGTDPSGGSLEAVTQFPMETAESIGLLKVDFLGLSTLTILRKACDLINRHHNKNYTMDNIPYRHDDTVNEMTEEDKRRLDEAFKMMGRGETVGVFQVESPGMQSMLRGMRPKEFENIIAGISLYRPGPMEFIPDYNKRLHGEEDVPYKHPKLEPILAETYGIMVYQEQLMQIGGELFGYDLGEADLMRRAVSKKKQKALLEHKAIFKERGPENGISAEVAEEIFKDIEFFANYGFNKCLVGSTEIVDAATGRIVTIEDLYQQKETVSQTITCDTDALRFQHGSVTDVIYNGVKPVYRLTTQTGRQIDATGNHPFYVFDEWRNLEDLQVGDRIAVPRCLPVEGTRVWSYEQIEQFVADFDSFDVLPDEVFEITNDCLIELLGQLAEQKLFVVGKHVIFGVKEERKSRQLIHLLSRLGIVAEQLVVVFQNTNEPVVAPSYEVRIPQESLSAFASRFSNHVADAQLAKIEMMVVEEAQAETTDVYWDAIKSIEYIGEQPTYDLTIANTHNFVANDILVHNSHATDYAVITVQSAFLKCHYPHEFLTALLCVQFDDSTKVATFLEECRRLNIDVLPPDVNYSHVDFDIEVMPNGERGIRFGMGAIKNAGVGALQLIIDEREANGRFESLVDFCHRVNLKDVGKRTIESLIRVGAFGDWGDRNDLLYSLERIVGFSANYHKAQAAGQMSLFGEASGFEDSLQLPEAPIGQQAKPREQLAWEKELMGLYVTGRPVDPHKEKFRLMGNLSIIQDLKDPDKAHGQNGQQVKIAGEVVNVREVFTKKQDQMAILQVEDWHESANSIEVVCFPQTWGRVKDYVHRYKKERADNPDAPVEETGILKLEEGDIVMVVGKFDTSRGDIQIICDKIDFEFEYMSTDEVVEYYAEETNPAWYDDNNHSNGNSNQGYVSSSEEPPPPPAWFNEETDNAPTHQPEPPPPEQTIPATQGASNGHAAVVTTNDNGTAPSWTNGTGADLHEANPFADMIDEKETGETVHIRVAIARSREPDKDRRKLRRIHNCMVTYPGHDSFSIVIGNGDKAVEMVFPEITTCWCDELRRDLVTIVGEDNIHIE